MLVVLRRSESFSGQMKGEPICFFPCNDTGILHCRGGVILSLYHLGSGYSQFLTHLKTFAKLCAPVHRVSLRADIRR